MKKFVIAHPYSEEYEAFQFTKPNQKTIDLIEEATCRSVMVNLYKTGSHQTFLKFEGEEWIENVYLGDWIVYDRTNNVVGVYKESEFPSIFSVSKD